MSRSINDVKTFWDANPCQSTLSDQQDRKKYFEEITIHRYNGFDRYVPIIAKFENFKDYDILEIGCGIGTDGQEFSKNGAQYVGIDLAPSSIKMAKERFELFNIKGKLVIANAEKSLPFPDNLFDHIYSFGVIHHSPNAEAIVEEMYRVLKPGGTFCVMIYNKSSINYYIEIMFLRKLLCRVIYPKFMLSLISKITGFAEWKLRGHREIIMKKGNMSKEEWISINTDGPYCPLAKVYDKKEAFEIFKIFEDLRMEVWGFDTSRWLFIGKLIPASVSHRLGRIWGWHRIVYGRKPV